MSESTKVIAALKKSANYTKLAMRKNGPRSFKRGQGALIKVIYKFGNGALGRDEAKKQLGWRGRDVRFVAKKAADNGYLTIKDPKDGFNMTLTELGEEIIKKRLEAEDKAADEILACLTDAEKDQLLAICEKIDKTAEDMGVNYAKIQKRQGRKHHHGKRRHGKCGHRNAYCHHEHEGCARHDAPEYVFVFGGQKPDCHHSHGRKHGHGKDHGCKRH